MSNRSALLILVLFGLMLVSWDVLTRFVPDTNNEAKSTDMFTREPITKTDVSTALALIDEYLQGMSGEVIEPIVAEVITDEVDETTQEGDVESVWIDNVQYNLKGVFTQSDAQFAVLQAAQADGDNAFHQVASGEKISNYTIEQIELDSVVLLSPNNKTINLKLFVPEPQEPSDASSDNDSANVN